MAVFRLQFFSFGKNSLVIQRTIQSILYLISFSAKCLQNKC